MKRTLVGILSAYALASSAAGADSAVRFKLGTFERDGKRFVGVVVRDTLVIDLAVADAALHSAS